MKGIANFRDFGGHALAGGGRIATGRLFRSGSLGKATDDDLARLAGLGIGALVDLRRGQERATDPNRLPPGFAGPVFLNPDDSDTESPHIAFLRVAGENPAELDAMIEYYYRAMPLDRDLNAVLRATIAFLLERDDPVLIHCSAGKDRAGFVAATLLQALGVDEEAILADYLRSTQLTDEARFEAVVAALERETGRKLPLTTVRRMFGIEPHWIEYPRRAIRDEFGSQAAYLATLGLDEAALERLRSRLVE